LSLCNFSSGNVHCLTFFILLAIMIFSIHKLLDSCVWANSSIITHLYSVKLARLVLYKFTMPPSRVHRAPDRSPPTSELARNPCGCTSPTPLLEVQVHINRQNIVPISESRSVRQNIMETSMHSEV
jgi:hypothetical protein